MKAGQGSHAANPVESRNCCIALRNSAIWFQFGMVRDVTFTHFIRSVPSRDGLPVSVAILRIATAVPNPVGDATPDSAVEISRNQLKAALVTAVPKLSPSQTNPVGNTVSCNRSRSSPVTVNHSLERLLRTCSAKAKTPSTSSSSRRASANSHSAEVISSRKRSRVVL